MPIAPPLGRILAYLRERKGLLKKELARLHGYKDETLISRYESGLKELSREKLEEMLEPLDTPPEAVDLLLFAEDLLDGSPPEPAGSPVALTAEERRRVDRDAMAAGWAAAEQVRRELARTLRGRKAAQARREAEELWACLAGATWEECRDVVTVFPEFRSWALAELLCKESIRSASHDPGKSLNLAELALFVAERVPEDETWRFLLVALCWAHIGNAKRVANDLDGAREAFARAKDLWQAGAVASPEPLEEFRLPDLEASLRRAERLFPEALVLIDQALAVAAADEARGRILLKKSSVLEQMGDAAGTLEALQQATPLLGCSEEPRLLFGLHFNITASLCDLERYAEADKVLPKVRELAFAQRKALDLTRLLWLQGRVLAGIGKTESALIALEQVQRDFTERTMAYDAALVSLHLAILLLEQGRNAEVRRLAEQMLWIFQDKKIHRETLASLAVFCEALRQDAATVELARQTLAGLKKEQGTAPQDSPISPSQHESGRERGEPEGANRRSDHLDR